MEEKPVPRVHHHFADSGLQLTVPQSASEIERHNRQRKEIEAFEQERLKSIEQFQADWDTLQKDNVPQDVIERLLRRLLPARPE